MVATATVSWKTMQKPILFVVSLLTVCFVFVEHKIVIIGLDNAGKTTILYQFLMNEVVHTSPTIGSNVEEVVWNNIHFIMWDLGGQQSLRAAWSTYYCNTEVYLSELICFRISFSVMILNIFVVQHITWKGIHKK